MKRHILFIPLILLGIVVMALGTYAQTATSKDTTDFVQTVTIASNYEIQSSKIALTRSQNEMVRDFAQTMIDDHGKAAAKLQAIVSDQKLLPPDESLDSKHQGLLDKLNAAGPGKKFDKAYIKQQIKAHDETIDLLTHYAKKGDDAALRDFATQTLPVVQHHRQMLDTLKGAY